MWWIEREMSFGDEMKAGQDIHTDKKYWDVEIGGGRYIEG
jgi:hypothetical protein